MKRAVRTVIRLVAAALLMFGLLSIGLEFARQAAKKAGGPGLWPWIIGAILLAAGVFLFMASASLAEQLTDDVDDESETEPGEQSENQDQDENQDPDEASR